MADIQFSHNMGAYGRTPEAQPEVSGTSLTTMTNLAGAALSLALIAGIGVWGYKLMVRDVSGIPVVRAVQGDMRVRPEEPGGQLARHQGLAVNSVAAEGFASGPVDQVALAPRTGGLAQEDQPVPAVAPVIAPEALRPAAEAFDPPSAPVDPAPETVTADVPAPAKKTPAAKGPADTDAAVLLAAAEALPLPEEVLADGPGLKISARPRLRPATAPAMVQNASFTTAPATAEIDPSKIPGGTRLVQLGAFDSAAIARGEWDRLATSFGDYLDGKSRVVQEAQSGGRTFYRLRAMGFKDLNDSRRFCAAFKAEGVDCIPVASK